MKTKKQLFLIFSISCLALIFLSCFLYKLLHWKIAIYAQNDLSVPLCVEIDVCDKHKEIKLDVKEFRADCLSIKKTDDDSISGTLRIFDKSNNRMLFEAKLNRRESILGQNNDEFPLYVSFMIFQDSKGDCNVAFDSF